MRERRFVLRASRAPRATLTSRSVSVSLSPPAESSACVRRAFRRPSVVCLLLPPPSLVSAAFGYENTLATQHFFCIVSHGIPDLSSRASTHRWFLRTEPRRHGRIISQVCPLKLHRRWSSVVLLGSDRRRLRMCLDRRSRLWRHSVISSRISCRPGRSLRPA